MIAPILTIANKIPRTKTMTGIDIWKKHTLNDVQFKVETLSQIVNNNVVIGESYLILLPFDDEYVEPEEWYKSPIDGYTVATGDLIFFFDLQEDISANNIQTLKAQYKSKVCEVKAITEVQYVGLNKIRLKIEGV